MSPFEAVPQTKIDWFALEGDDDVATELKRIADQVVSGMDSNAPAEAVSTAIKDAIRESGFPHPDITIDVNDADSTGERTYRGTAGSPRAGRRIVF